MPDPALAELHQYVLAAVHHHEPHHPYTLEHIEAQLARMLGLGQDGAMTRQAAPPYRFRQEPGAGAGEVTRYRLLVNLGDGLGFTGILGTVSHRLGSGPAPPGAPDTWPHYWLAVRFGEHQAYHVDEAGQRQPYDATAWKFGSRRKAADALVLNWQRSLQEVTSDA